jgi:hypothetical protein
MRAIEFPLGEIVGNIPLTCSMAFEQFSFIVGSSFHARYFTYLGAPRQSSFVENLA